MFPFETINVRRAGYLAISAVAILLLSAAAATGQETDASDTTMSLRGDEDGTVLGSMTVEEENRVQIDFERPDLQIDLDARNAPGLVWGGPQDVLTRSTPDFLGPYLAVSAHVRSPYAPSPWLDGFRTGPLARFRPAVEHVASWTLTVVDSRGEVVTVFKGESDPPDEIGWDGRTSDGEPCLPGFTYSYVFESLDRAGNKRRIVGEGFKIPPYRLDGDGTPTLLLAGSQLAPAAGGAIQPLLLEIASRLNLRGGSADPVRILAVARNFETADALGRSVRQQLQELVPGDPARLSVTTRVEPGAPEAGALMIGPASVAGTTTAEED